MRPLLVFAALLLFAINSRAQFYISSDSTAPAISPKRYNEYFPPARITALNMSPLLTYLIPFNRSNPRLSGPIQARFRYARKGKAAFRMGLGVSIINNLDGDNTNFLNMELGWERRRNLSKRWAYVRSTQLFFSAGRVNVPGSTLSEVPGIGLGWGMGVEYALAKGITLSTEAMLLAPFLNDDGFNFEFLPPVGLFLNYYIH